MTEYLLEFLSLAVYAYCICYAVASDVRELKIPNWVPIAMAIGFIPYIAFSWDEIDFAMRFFVVALMFFVGLFLFYKGWLGGGDVKLLAAVSLWIGPEHIFLFIILMSLIGLILALVLILLRQYVLRKGLLNRAQVPQPVAKWIQEGVCPYGVAIGFAGLAMLPRIFDY